MKSAIIAIAFSFPTLSLLTGPVPGHSHQAHYTDEKEAKAGKGKLTQQLNRGHLCFFATAAAPTVHPVMLRNTLFSVWSTAVPSGGRAQQGGPLPPTPYPSQPALSVCHLLITLIPKYAEQ